MKLCRTHLEGTQWPRWCGTRSGKSLWVWWPVGSVSASSRSPSPSSLSPCLISSTLPRTMSWISCHVVWYRKYCWMLRWIFDIFSRTKNTKIKNRKIIKLLEVIKIENPLFWKALFNTQERRGYIISTQKLKFNKFHLCPNCSSGSSSIIYESFYNPLPDHPPLCKKFIWSSSWSFSIIYEGFDDLLPVHVHA